MTALLLFVLLSIVLYAMGRFALGKGVAAWSFFRVFVFFLLIMVGNIVILATMVSVILALVAAVLSFIFVLSPQFEQSTTTLYHNISEGKFAFTMDHIPTVRWLLGLLVIILSVALIHAWIRRKLLKHLPWLRMTMTEYQISEYFIQWATIYVVVYQLFFNALESLAAILPEITNWHNAFQVLLSPDNVNAVIQPLLIATWVTIVLERLTIEHNTHTDQTTLVHAPRKPLAPQIRAYHPRNRRLRSQRQRVQPRRAQAQDLSPEPIRRKPLAPTRSTKQQS